MFTGFKLLYEKHCKSFLICKFKFRFAFLLFYITIISQKFRFTFENLKQEMMIRTLVYNCHECYWNVCFVIYRFLLLWRLCKAMINIVYQKYVIPHICVYFLVFRVKYEVTSNKSDAV